MVTATLCFVNGADLTAAPSNQKNKWCGTIECDSGAVEHVDFRGASEVAYSVRAAIGDEETASN